MNQPSSQVPYGYEPPKETSKGTLFIYDSYDTELAADAITETALASFAHWAERRMLQQVVLYLPREETLRRMGSSAPTPLYKREKALRDTASAFDLLVPLRIDTWEQKRKSYTPIDVALRYMTRTYPSPYFVGMTMAMANRFASYNGFEEWIRDIRLVIAADARLQPHPLLQSYAHRWSLLTDM